MRYTDSMRGSSLTDSLGFPYCAQSQLSAQYGKLNASVMYNPNEEPERYNRSNDF